jgi:transcriptional regulator with XRE-family HTH domain
MASLDDKKAFSERLTQALKRSGRDATSATQLAMQFNLRHPNEPVTAQAAQKWLTGKARPTRDKVDTLAQWLDVSSDWLRLGISHDLSAVIVPPGGDTKTLELTLQDLDLLNKFKMLSESQRQLLIRLIEELSTERMKNQRK